MEAFQKDLRPLDQLTRVVHRKALASDDNTDWGHLHLKCLERCNEPWGPWKSEQRTGKTCTITVIAGPRRPNARGALVYVYPVRKVVRP